MDLLEILLYIQIVLSASCLYRIIRGPSVADRMVAIDIFGVLVVGICAILSIKPEEVSFLILVLPGLSSALSEHLPLQNI